MAFEKGDRVRWSWGRGEAEGVVREVHRERVERRIEGATVVRNADDAEPAYLIEQDDGDEVLKSESELERG
jgi:hypothetical protein